MQSFRRILPLSCLLAVSALPALSEGLYVESHAGLFSATNLEDFGDPGDLDFSTLGLRGGYQLDRTWTIEADLQVGANDDAFALASPDMEAITDLTAVVAAFARAETALTDHASMHVRLGYAFGELEAQDDPSGARPRVETFAGLAYGVGATLDLTNSVYIRADYTQIGGDDAKTDSVTLGVGVRF